MNRAMKTQPTEKATPVKPNGANSVATELASLLAKKRRRIVFAESCTCGLVAALLGQVPGISQWLCGSAVTYRVASKIAWLDVNAKTIAQHTAESSATTTEMASGILAETVEADLALAVTGHLGPGVPENVDGKIMICLVDRASMDTHITTLQLCEATRIGRQLEAAEHVLRYARDYLSEHVS